MSSQDPTPFDLGPWRVEPLLNQLVAEGEPPVSASAKHITPKTMEVLLYLADHAGEVVTRAALLDAIWPRTHIREEVLTRTISDLRSALEDDRRAPRFIETIPKVGYRLIAPIRRAAPADDDPGEPPLSEPAIRPTSTAAPGPASRVRVAVLAGAVLAMALVALGMGLSRGPDPPAVVMVTTPAPLQAVPLTTMPGFESFAEISPDGHHVVYAHYNAIRSDSPAAGRSANIDLYVQALEGGEPLQLTTNPAPEVGATWSPDGLRLAFGRYQLQEGAEERCTVLEIPARGGPERRLGSCGNNGTADFAWSPSGEWIAFSDRREGDKTFGIYLLSTLTGESHQLVAPDEAHWGDRDPQFSPDGSQVAFARSVSMETQDVFRIPVAGGEPVAVTRDRRSVRGLTWLPDGSGLVVSSRRAGSRGLWRFPLDGSSPSWLPIAVDHAWSPTLSRHSGTLLFEVRVLEAGLQQRALNGDSEPTAWLASTREDVDPQHSPDGQRIAFTSNRSGHFEIWSAAPDGSELVQLTALNGAYNGSPRWSPDSRSIVFDARLDGQADVYRVVPGEAPERLTRDPANDLGPSYSPDGNWVYFGSNRTGDWQIWRLPTAGGQAVQVTLDGGYEAQVSTDGETLFLTRFGQSDLFRVPLGGGAELPVAGGESIPEAASLLSSEHWTLVGDTLYWISNGEGGRSLERLLPGGERERVADLGSVGLMPGLSVAADESSMLYAERLRLEADLWRVDHWSSSSSP